MVANFVVLISRSGGEVQCPACIEENALTEFSVIKDGQVRLILTLFGHTYGK